jgi:ribosomal protein S18 acetylase RimI-like enzyme
MMTATIRRAVSGDEPVLAELNGFIQELHVRNNPAYFKPTVREDVVAWFQGLLQKPNAWVWIAEEDGVAVGYVSALQRERAESPFSHARRWLEIDHIGVHPEQRRRGLCRALVEVVLEAADDQGLRDVELSSWVFNSGAHEAFRRLGFQPKVVRFGRESVDPAARGE